MKILKQFILLLEISIIVGYYIKPSTEIGLAVIIGVIIFIIMEFFCIYFNKLEKKLK